MLHPPTETRRRAPARVSPTSVAPAMLLVAWVACACGARDSLPVGGDRDGAGGAESASASSIGTGATSDAAGSTVGTGPTGCLPTTATTIAAEQFSVHALAVHGGHVYFAANDDVRRVPVCGGAVEILDYVQAATLAAGAPGVAWDAIGTAPSTLRLLRAGASAPETLVQGGEGELVLYPVLDDAGVTYLRFAGDGGHVVERALFAAPSAQPKALEVFASGTTSWNRLAGNERDVFYEASYAPDLSGAFFRIPKDGAPPVMLDDDVPVALVTAADESVVVRGLATTNGVAGVLRVDDAVTGAPIASTQFAGPVAYLALDGGRVAYSVAGAGVGWAPTSTLLGTTVAASDDVGGVAVDAEAIYYADRSAQTIVRVPKASLAP